jgi:hypothetical protein
MWYMPIFRCQAIGSLPAGESFSFGVHTEKGAGTISAAYAAWADAVDLLWNGVASPDDSIKQLYTPGVTIDELVVTQLDPDTGKNVLQERGSVSLVGTGSGDALPTEVAICVSLRTALPTRAGRGRYFLPNPRLATCVGTKLDATAQGQVAAASAGMLGDLSTIGYPAVILHRRTLTTDVVTSTDVGDIFDVQRSRRTQLRESRVSVAL